MRYPGGYHLLSIYSVPSSVSHSFMRRCYHPHMTGEDTAALRNQLSQRSQRWDPAHLHGTPAPCSASAPSEETPAHLELPGPTSASGEGRMGVALQ